MLRGATLLAFLFPLAVPAWAAELEVQALPESSVEQVSISLTATLDQGGVSCEESSLAIQGPGLPKPLAPPLTDCKVEQKKLTARASFQRKQVGTEKAEVVLRFCPGEENCTLRESLPDPAGALKAWPLILEKVDTARGELVFQGRELPPDLGRANTVRVADWSPAQSKPSGQPPRAVAGAKTLTLTLPMGCSSVELFRTELTQAEFEMRDTKGFPLRFTYEGALPLCGRPASFLSTEVRWLAAGGMVLLLSGLFAGIRVEKRRRSRTGTPPSTEPPPWVGDSFKDFRTLLEGSSQSLKESIEETLKRLSPAKLPESTVEGEAEDTGTPPSVAVSKLTAQERDLLQAVNEWWAEGASDKDVLISRLGSQGAKIYVSFDIDSTLQRMVGRTFSFRPSDGPAGWAWYPMKGEALAVPADPFLFHAGNMIEILRLLFDGIGESPKSFRFYRVQKACRLRAKSPGSDRYQLVEKGYLELADRSGARISGPPRDKAQTSRPAASPQKVVSEAPQPAFMPGPTLRDIEDRLRLALREEIGRLGPAQGPRTADNSREAIDGLRSQIDHLAADLRRLDSIQQALSGIASKMDSLKQVPKAVTVEAPAAVPARKVESQVPPSPPPPPVLPALHRAEPDEAIAPPKTAAEQPGPGEFLKRVGQAFPMLQTAASAGPGSPAPSDYLRRLVQVFENLALARSDRGWEITLVHLKVVWISEKERMFSVHPVEINEDFREARCRCGELSEAYLLQVFLSIRYGEESLIAVAMAASNLAERFAEGYSLLTGDDSQKEMGTVVMKRPAVLQRAKGSAESWRVVLPMEVALR